MTPGNLIASGGQATQDWTKRDKNGRPVATYRASSPEVQSAEHQMRSARAAVEARRIQDERQARADRDEARSDFADYQRRYGANFDQKALETYQDRYATSGAKIVRDTVYGAEMKRLLEDHLRRTRQA